MAEAGRGGGSVLVAVDGPGGSGKSSVARRVARELGFAYLDTGATYRALTLAALRVGAEDDRARLERLAHDLTGSRLVLSTDPLREVVSIDGNDVTEEIRGARVTAAVSAVAAVPGVRRVLVDWQRTRAYASDRGCVLEGRDTGSVVAPDAIVKVWLTAAPEVRAARRGAELGVSAAVDLARRDNADAARAVDPMQPAPGAVVVDTSSLTLDQTVDRVLAHVRSALG